WLPVLLDQCPPEGDNPVEFERGADLKVRTTSRSRGRDMIRVTTGQTLSALAMSAALLVPQVATAADTPKAPVPTFTKDIAPIFQEKCEACHRPDSIAPMSLKEFSEVRPWVRSIRARVADRQMPPWQIDRSVGIQKFKNDRSLSDEQI